MKVLIIGSGGREHTLAWAFHKSPRVSQIYAAPGNDGMKPLATCLPMAEDDQEQLVSWALDEHIDLTVIGPEQPLADGLVDRFTAAGLRVFGPQQSAAVIEGSKSFAKQFMKRHQIPTADSQTFTSLASAKAYVKECGAPIVIKADGLAAGKGVTVAMTEDEAIHSLEEMLTHDRFSTAGHKVVIEEYLEGEEFSLMAFVSGSSVYPMVLSQDHKRAFTGDEGPNTGGMGAYSPVPQFSEDVFETAVQNILQPTAEGLSEEGRSFTGVLYAGLIQTTEGPKVIEFNARLGDPETQVVLPRLKNDLAQVISDVMAGVSPNLQWHEQAVVGVVLAVNGYPGAYDKGAVITGLSELQDDTLVFHAGTVKENGQWLANGGRVLLLSRQADSLEQAVDQVYADMQQLAGEAFFYRTDIASQGL